jgi:hypothetical protein
MRKRRKACGQPDQQEPRISVGLKKLPASHQRDAGPMVSAHAIDSNGDHGRLTQSVGSLDIGQ